MIKTRTCLQIKLNKKPQSLNQHHPKHLRRKNYEQIVEISQIISPPIVLAKNEVEEITDIAAKAFRKKIETRLRTPPPLHSYKSPFKPPPLCHSIASNPLQKRLLLNGVIATVVTPIAALAGVAWGLIQKVIQDSPTKKAAGRNSW